MWDHTGRQGFATYGIGAVVWEATYLPFGGVNTSPGSNRGIRFPGQFYQSESGLHQNWMRDYDPTTGRYIQGDPLGLVDGASVYGYALQNPMVYIDPFGLDAYVSIIDAAAGDFGHAGIGTSSEQTFGHYCAETPNCFGGPGETKADDMTKVTRMLRISLSDEDTQ